jgi:tetratricopeptide (TPR) repeat protein
MKIHLIHGLVLLACLAILGLILYQLPPIHERVSWRIDNLRAKIYYYFNPPEEEVFLPQTPTPMPDKTSTNYPITREAPSLPLTSTAAVTQPPKEEPTLTPTLSPTKTLAPLPPTFNLEGVRHEYQKWNNCGPANLSMLLSYWGWQGDQREIAAELKPNPRDNNVMPAELLSYIQQHTDLKAILRVGGNVDLIKRSIANGFPLLIEKGFDHDNGWIGHYQVINGYDDQKKKFITQDSLIAPNYPVAYEQFDKEWRAFNRLFIIAYPPEKEEELQNLLQEYWDEKTSYQIALQQAQSETKRLSGRDLTFAWFNLGTNAVALQDFPTAAAAYDKYFALYSALPKSERPWRMMWYQNGPYVAYYSTQRYQDVIALATVTLSQLSERLLEEACYWRALAELKLGDEKSALRDLQQAVERNPHFLPAQEELQRLQVAPTPQ